MDKRVPVLYVLLGLGLLFLIPAAESVGRTLGHIATFLVIGYWAMLALCFVIPLVKNFFAEFGLRSLLFNLWLFLSLMCVAVGVLAIVDDGMAQARWAAWLIVYGLTVAYFNRKEL